MKSILVLLSVVFFLVPSAAYADDIFIDNFDDIDSWTIVSGVIGNWYSEPPAEAVVVDPPASPLGNVFHADGCNRDSGGIKLGCDAFLNDPLDLTIYDTAMIEFDYFVDDSLDAGESCSIRLFDGSSYNLVWKKDGVNSPTIVDDDNIWHHDSIDLTGTDYLDTDSFNIKFNAIMSVQNEECEFDNLSITGTLSENSPPTADAGLDQTVDETTLVTLDGTGSSDSDGTVEAYAWTQTDGPAVTLSDATASPTFTAPEVGPGGDTLTFELVVTDDDTADSTADSVIITVDDVVAPNVPPTADAGLDQTVDETTLVTLDGTGSSDSDGTVEAYAWTQTDGPAVTLSDATASPTFTAPEVGPGGDTLTFELVVTDDDTADSTADSVIITVDDVVAPNVPPTADAGLDQTVDETTLVTLDGTGSSDSDGTVEAYAWTQTDGPAVTLSDATASPTFTAPEVGPGGDTLTFELVVTDDDTADSTADSVIITVDDVVAPNVPPTADAGLDQTVDETTLVTLDGTGSSDSDGTVEAYAWTQTDGPAVTLSDATASPTFTAPEVGPGGDTLTFELVVTDDDTADSTADSVIITVDDVVAPNVPPTADAGLDQTVDETTLVTLDGTGSSDSDGTVEAYAWTQTDGPAVTLSDATASPTFTAPEVGPGGDTLTFELVVTDDDTADSTADSVIITVDDSVDPETPTISINDVSQLETDSGDTDFEFTVTRSGDTSGETGVSWYTEDGTATDDSDYSYDDGFLLFTPGQTTKTVTVFVNGDTLVEPDETFFIDLYIECEVLCGADHLLAAQGVGTILNDDENSVTGPGFYGSDRDGFIFLFDPSGPTITEIGYYTDDEGEGSTEIECSNDGVDCFSQTSDWEIEKFSPSVPTVLGPLVEDNKYNGLEYVGSTLYGIYPQYIPAADVGSLSHNTHATLETLNPFTGDSVEIGLTGINGPMSGLAYNGIMYAISGGACEGDDSMLYTINLSTGEATLVGDTEQGLGSLEFGPDGVLYAGGNDCEGGNIYSINTATGEATFVIWSGLDNVTGLTLVGESVTVKRDNGGSPQHEPPSFGESPGRDYWYHHDAFCLDGECYDIPSDYVVPFDLIELETGLHTWSISVYCSKGVQDCVHVGLSVQDYKTDVNSADWLIEIDLPTSTIGDEWALKVYDPPTDELPDGYLGEVTATTQIIETGDKALLLASFTIDHIAPMPEGKQFGLHAWDRDRGVTNSYQNHGIAVEDRFAYPTTDAAFDEPLNIPDTCINENPDNRYSCAFSLKKQNELDRAEKVMEDLMNLNTWIRHGID